MSITTTKTLSPAELAKLEHAFATEPASEAYKPLAEAYLGMGRFMEAMVVCKKGVKAHPSSADPRVLLARVYAEQGKEKKAIEELLGALQVAPKDKQALRLAGSLQMKAGETEAGKANLLKAFEADPADADTKAALAQWKVDPPRAEAPPPPAPAPVPVAGPGAMRQEPARPHRGGAQAAAVPVGASAAVPEAVRAAPAAAPVRNGAAHAYQAPQRPASAPVSRPGPRMAPVRAYEEDDDDEISLVRRGREKQVNRKNRFFITLGVAVVLVIGSAVYTSARKTRNKEVNKRLGEAVKLIKDDNYDSYQKATETAALALEADSGNAMAHSVLAYVHALRFGEHGGGEEARQAAMTNLEEARDGGKPNRYLYAADALLKSYSGKGVVAATELEQRIQELDATSEPRDVLYLTLGIIQMNVGQLERAQETLEKAQTMVSHDDPRVYAALGTLYRRRGMEQQALKMFDAGAQVASRVRRKEHPESVLGASLVILEQEQVGFERFRSVAEMLKKLLQSDPAPSKRQLATAQAARALLIAQVSANAAALNPDQIKTLSTTMGATLERPGASADISKAEGAASTMDPQNPELRILKARRLLVEGQVDAAVREAREALKVDSSRAQFHTELARALLRKPDGEKEAQEVLSNALRTVGDSPRLVIMLGEVLQKQGKVDEAISQLNRAIASSKGKSAELRIALGVALREKKDFAKSQEALDQAARESLDQQSRRAAALTELGRTLEAKGDRPKAEEAFRNALNADPLYGPMYYWYAVFLNSEAEQKPKVKTLAQEYLKREPAGVFAEAAKKLSE